jgi:hypothetical protein
VVCLAAGPVVGQQKEADGPFAQATNSPAPMYDSTFLLPLLPSQSTLKFQDIIKQKPPRPVSFFSNPLKAIKQNGLLGYPLKLLKALNPFATTPADENPGAFAGSLPMNASRAARKEAIQEKARSGDLNPRAWTTMVGWHPGESVFYDPITFEW